MIWFWREDCRKNLSNIELDEKNNLIYFNAITEIFLQSLTLSVSIK